jgi:sulfur relay (sulfurtransferase) DsrC/TusE family protein
MENKDIIDNLLQNWKNNIEQDNEDETQVWEIRIISIRYRLYSIILIVLIIVWIFNYILPKQESYQNSNNTLQWLRTEVDKFSTKQKELQVDVDLSNKIENWEEKILACINNQQWCDQLDPQIKNNFSEVTSYLQANSLSSTKMSVDEKMILKNINEYLTKEDFNSISKNWLINKISIWDPTEFKSRLYYVTINLNITFQNKDWLLSFIHNIERKINPEKDLRILYKIDQISYDLMAYEQEQNVDIYLKAFYYK